MSGPGPVLYCGDTHGKFRHVIQAAGDLRASAVVLLGDLEPRRPLHEELASIVDKVWFIHGNHDTDSPANWGNVWQSKLADRNVDGRVVMLPDGTRLAGLGGVFRGTVWYPTPTGDRGGAPAFRSREEHASLLDPHHHWQDSVNLTHWSSIYPDVFERLADLRTDVLVTHEAPGYHPRGFELLDTLAQSMGVKVTVHGHHHDRLDSSDRWSTQGFRSFGVGLRGITSIDLDGNAEVIVAGELDEERNHRQRYLEVFKHILDEGSEDGSRHTLGRQTSVPEPMETEDSDTEHEVRIVLARVDGLVPEFDMVDLVDEAEDRSYAVTARTRGVDWRALQVGQVLRCKVQGRHALKVLSAEVVDPSCDDADPSHF